MAQRHARRTLRSGIWAASAAASSKMAAHAIFFGISSVVLGGREVVTMRVAPTLEK